MNLPSSCTACTDDNNKSWRNIFSLVMQTANEPCLFSPSLHSSAKQEFLVGGQSWKLSLVCIKWNLESLWKIVQSWFCFFFFSDPWKDEILSSISVGLLTEILQNGSCLSGTVVLGPEKPTSAWAVWLCPMESDAWSLFWDVQVSWF